MIVVSDTSPLNYLVLLDQIEILPSLFADVYTTPRVIEELLHPRAPAAVQQWAQSPPAWLRVIAPRNPEPFIASLDLGEAEAISPALELHAPAVLIDEKKGRQIARSQGLVTMGTVTILELASQQNLVDLRKAFDSLSRTSFHIRQSYLDEALAREVARKRT